MAEDVEGFASAVAQAMELAPALPVRGATAEQLALLPETGRITRDQVEALPRGRGRPPGASNRRTAAWRDYLLSRYTHPLETLMAIQSTPADVLAAELGCKPVEALAIIKSAAAEAAPYMESKMATIVDATNTQRVAIIMPGLNVAPGATAAELEAYALDPEALDFDIMPSAKPAGSQVAALEDGSKVE